MRYVRVFSKRETFWGILEQEAVQKLGGAPYDGAGPSGQRVPLSECRLLAPCQPTKIVCIGKNYREHAIEMNEGIPENPILFIKPSTCLNDPGGAVEYPPQSARVDYEGELAVVIKKTARRIKREEAYDYVLGYTCLNDVTARDIQKSDGQWTRGKGFDTFCPVGPWIVTGIDPSDLKVETRLNGKTVQSSRTSLLTWDVPSLIEFITAGMTLLPGDLIATGTPAGIGPMQIGDRVEVEVEGIGILENHITGE